MKFNELGRSMVEMLGVLAIIGVLSVGAIAGYSKAMMKYKLNKQAESMNMLFINAFEISHKLINTSTNGAAMHFAETLYKLNMLPDGISRRNSTYLNDIFKNDIWVFAYPTVYGLAYRFSSDNNGLEICRNLLNVYKEHSGILYNAYSQIQSQSEDGDTEYSSNTLHGDAYCDTSKNKRCIRSLTLEDFDTLCNSCLKESSGCVFYATWK